MHRFFVPLDQIKSNTIYIKGSDVVHIKDVLRLKANDKIYVFDGNGFRYHVGIHEIKKKFLTGQILLKEPFNSESSVQIFLGQALLKGNKFDQIIRRAVELGVVKIFPLITERTLIKISQSEIREKAVRWQKISLEASKQCGRSCVPKIEPVVLSLTDFCTRDSEWNLKVCFWADATSCIKDISQNSKPKKIALLIGPEGGFSSSEIIHIEGLKFQLISLGPRILRAETAPIAAISIVQSLWGDF